MAQPEPTPQLALLEEAVTDLFCRIDDTYYHLNPKGRDYETTKELSDSEIMTLALLEATAGYRERLLGVVGASIPISRGWLQDLR
jgi:hypothetical protein